MESIRNVTREVILDLLPVYLAGEASPATRTLVEEYLKQDAELAQRIRVQWADSFAKAVPSALPPRFGVTIPSSHAKPAWLAEVAIWVWDFLLSHVLQQ
jgi:hypothetical protein